MSPGRVSHDRSGFLVDHSRSRSLTPDRGILVPITRASRGA